MILSNELNQKFAIFGQGTLRIKNILTKHKKSNRLIHGLSIHDSEIIAKIGCHKHETELNDFEIALFFTSIEGINVLQGLLDHIECLMIEEDYMMSCLKEMNQ